MKKPSRKLALLRSERSFNRTHQPTVSVIIPTYNQKDLLELVLVALFNQDYPRDKYEIIVADDGSSDGTKELIAKISKKSPIPLKYCFQEDKGFRAGQARNLGASNANGAVLVFIDSDVVPFRSFVSNHVKNQKKGVVLGYSCAYGTDQSYNLSEVKEGLVGKGNPLFLFRKEFRHNIFLDTKKSNSMENRRLWYLFVTNNFSIKKGIFDEFKFDERFVGWGEEDVDLGYRLYKGGYVLNLCKGAKALHLTKQGEGQVRNYNSWKIDSLVINMKILYNKYRNDEIRDYITDRFLHLPRSLVSGRYTLNQIFGQ